MIAGRAGLLVLTGLVAGCVQIGIGATPPAAEAEGPALRARVIFSDGLDDHQAPVRALRAVPLAAVPFYVYVDWLDLEPGDHAYELEIFDAAGELVSVQRMAFTNPSLGWKTVSWYRPMPGVDAPGTWRFEFQMDGVPALQAELEVGP